MPPKRNKSITPSAVTPTAAPSGNKDWATALAAAVFEENCWRASLSLVQAERASDEQIISRLQRAVQRPLRKLFSVLSWENMLEEINELGNPKTRKTKDVPVFYEVTEVAKSLMDAGEDISVDLMAKLIKFKLLSIKNNDIQRRTAEEKAVEENAHGKAGVRSAGKDQGGKGAAKGKKPAEPPAPTKDTKLKRRGEEENPTEYIDDEPDEGPQHYILMTGFHRPHLLSALNSLGIHVSNVIKLCVEREDQSEALEETSEEDSNSSHEDQEVRFLKQRRQQELDDFWKQLDGVLNSGSVGSSLHDVARLSYSVKIDLLPQDTGNTEAMMAFGAAVFEGVACLVYDSLDWRRQYSHYLSSMRLIQVPVASRPDQNQPQSPSEAVQTPRKKGVTEEDNAESESPALSTEVDMRYYCDLLDRIPPGLTSVPLILHCILEQVAASEQEVMSASVDSKQHFDETAQDLMSYMISSVLRLPQPEEDKKKLMEDLGIQDTPLNEVQKEPLLINHHDERARRLHQLPALDGFDVTKLEADIMKQSLMWTSLMSRYPEGSSDRLARSQELLHFCTDESTSWSELQRLLQLLVFESMRLTTVDENDCVIASEPPRSTPWTNPVEFTKQLYWNYKHTSGLSESSAGAEEQKSNKVTITDLQNTLIRQLGDWNFVENHSAGVFPQILQSASETYRCVDKLYCSRDNATYIICHNPMSPHRSCKAFWDASLHTDVGFRNYLEYVAESVSEWIRHEEEKWQTEQERKETERASILTPSETDMKTDSPMKPLISDTAELFIRKDSLKAWKMEQERLKEEEPSKKIKKEKGGKATPKIREAPDSAKKTPISSRKSRENLSKTPSSALLPREETPEDPTDTTTNAFTGYCLNGKLVRISGNVQSLFPCDGGQIDVESFHFKQGLKQMTICVKKDGHHFYTHISERKKEHDHLKDINMINMINKADDCGVKADSGTERCASFYAVLANGIQLSCSHTSPAETRAQTLHQTEPNLCTDQLQEQIMSPEGQCDHTNFSSPAFLSLHVSVPNGLILHFDCDNFADGRSSSRSLLIQQRYYNSVSRSDLCAHTEVSRVMTCTGTVIKHMSDGSTEIMFADGTVSKSPDSGPVCVLVPRPPTEDVESVKEPAVDIREIKDKKGKPDSTVNTADEQHNSVDHEKPTHNFEVTGGSWATTTPSGLRVASVAGKEIKMAPVLSYHATDPFSGTVVVTREDKVLSVLRKDGTVIVEHADGTRITTFYQQREPQQHLSSGEKLVRVEKDEFATVIMDHEGRSCDVLFGDGTSISATAHGSYKVYMGAGGVLYLDQTGASVYTSHQSATETDTLSQYVMNHRADVLCHVTDPDGNQFQVHADGQITVSSHGSEHQTLGESELQQKVALKTHPPRLFVVREDGSASELLRADDVEDLLQEAYSDPSIAVLTDLLPESRESCAITLLRPRPKDSHSCWLLPKQDDDIIPTHLKSRKWESFPPSEKKTPGPPFGTTLGSGFEVKKKSKCGSVRVQSVLECPDVLLVRQLIQNPPVTEAQRRNLQENMKVYLEHLLRRENQQEKIQLKDPRSAENHVHQNNLLQLILSLSDTEDPPVAMETRPLSADVASLYTEAVKAAEHTDEPPEDTEELTECASKQKHNSLWENRINRHRQELQEERRHRRALRYEMVTPYFHTELKEMTSFFSHEKLDLNSLYHHLPSAQKRGSGAPSFSMDSSSNRSSSRS